MIRGIEKESLRVEVNGTLSSTPHPKALGSALTHPKITTDFSEAQLELITGTHSSAKSCIDELTETHCYVYKHIEDEMLWSTSMPCVAPHDDAIPLGQYGTSNIGKVKTIYRRGLGVRYGRLMQTISGIHYNFSIPEDAWEVFAKLRNQQNTQAFRTQSYFELIRNFRRHSWLLILMFGASPALCKSFIQGQKHNLQELDEGTLYLPWATSLRMGNLGYQSDAQSQLHISYNSLGEYAHSMHHALSTPYAPYISKGIKKQGEYQQLNTSLIQIENEFYGTIRPKRTTKSGQRPLTALTQEGVEYIEVRCLDLNPFLPVGIDVEQIKFLDTFLLHCLFSPSPEDNPEESIEVQNNQLAVVANGRQPDLRIKHKGKEILLHSWAENLLRECTDIAGLLDSATDSEGNSYTNAVMNQQTKLNDLSLTPSAKVLANMQAAQIPFAQFALNQSKLHKESFSECRWAGTNLEQMDNLVKESHMKRKEIEANDKLDLDTFVQNYIKLPQLSEL